MESDKMFDYLIGYYGDPDYQFEYSVSSLDLKVYMLVYLPIPDEGLFTSTLMTAGFSALDVEFDEHKTECVFELKESMTREEFKNLGGQLVEQFAGCSPFLPHSIHKSNGLEDYPHFSGWLVLNYGRHEPYYYECEPMVRIFELIPLYPNEIEALSQQPPEILNAIIFRSHHVDWSNWNRPKSQIVHEATSGTWSYISKWHSEHRPDLYSSKKEGASQKSMNKLSKNFAVELPKDFTSSLMIQNGDLDFHSYQYLTCDQIIETVHFMTGLLKNNEFPTERLDFHASDPLLNNWWNELWIPFGRDSEGNLMCIDLDPSAWGTKGQIIYWQRSDGPIPTKYKSFFHWLFAYEQALYQGYYKVNEEGHIY